MLRTTRMMSFSPISTAVELRIGACTIDRAGGRILRAEAVTHVEPRVMDVLLALAERRGRTASRNELIEAVWGHPHISDETLSRCVCLLRKALGDARTAPRYVETIAKRGYRLLASVEGLPATARRTAPTHVAILPFVNLSGDPAHEYLADGLTELLITYLASLPSLRVVSRTSSMHYKNTRMRLSDIAQELDVTHVVEGSVLASRRAVQAVVQLIDAATDKHLLARSYERELSDSLQLQNDLASSMASAVGTSIGP
ncbi:MAG: winged helix-turn-helix domain-containing protein [Casimicrobiaceae bacterium]